MHFGVSTILVVNTELEEEEHWCTVQSRVRHRILWWHKKIRSIHEYRDRSSHPGVLIMPLPS